MRPASDAIQELTHASGEQRGCSGVVRRERAVGKVVLQAIEYEARVTDTGAIDAAIDDIMAKNADKVAEYRSGKDKLLGFFVGQVMKVTGGKAGPALLNERLKAKLAG